MFFNFQYNPFLLSIIPNLFRSLFHCILHSLSLTNTLHTSLPSCSPLSHSIHSLLPRLPRPLISTHPPLHIPQGHGASLSESKTLNPTDACMVSCKHYLVTTSSLFLLFIYSLLHSVRVIIILLTAIHDKFFLSIKRPE